MSSSDRLILSIGTQIESDKITDRRKGYEALSHILTKNLELNNPDDVWSKLFNSINFCLQQVCAKLNEDVSVGHASQIQIRDKSSHYLQEVLMLANRGKYIVEQFLEALSTRPVLKQGGDIYLVALVKTISIKNLYDDCTPAQWIELCEFCMKHLNNTNSNLDLSTLVKILKFVVCNGCKGSKLAIKLLKFLPNVIKLFDVSCIKTSKHLQEEIFSLTIAICDEISTNFPRTFCAFANDITPKLLLLYDSSDGNNEKKILGLLDIRNF
ncbi:uncharacterized protein LOC113367719 [Ctenocephalides felis]|uniref:uncharacterized protein LOC113367719 n=1 Tax=Ctenocephalides felis TaxID=7515 RepID=UPI000E6E2009|nr:uncharacterized protein LOC113367719 [Ctenocephalides felis]